MTTSSQPSSEKLAAKLENEMPIIKSYGFGWRRWLSPYTVPYPTQKVYELAELVLAQQRDIKQLKAELDELKKR